MIDGGGILSMVRVAGIISLSSAISGIMKETGLLDGIQKVVIRLGQKGTGYAATLVSSVVISMIACNQTLALLLSNQLCGQLYTEKEKLALDLEDTAEIVSPLVPWCIAGSVPMSTIGAPAAATFCGFYLILLPFWRLITSFYQRSRERR